MIGTMDRQGSLFYAAFDRQASLIKDDLLERVDALLGNKELLALVEQGLVGRSPGSAKTGRECIAPDRVLRSCVLKHIKGWSFRELEREIRCNLVYRHFTRFDQDSIPNYSTFSRNFGALGDELTKRFHAEVIQQARQDHIAYGKKLRTDTTVVESNIHHPTDSTLLQDGIRVLQRSLHRIAEHCNPGTLKIIDHARAAQRRVLTIHRAAKSFTEHSKNRLKQNYRGLVALTQGVLKQTDKVVESFKNGALEIVDDSQRLALELHKLDHFRPLVGKVVEQTKARVFSGDTHFAGKIVSLFEEHTQIICKGKAHKPTEFGRLTRIDEVENGIVSEYEIQQGNPPDVQAWKPALLQHSAIFGHAPKIATADRGFFSAKNEKEGLALGVEHVVIPGTGRLSKSRTEKQKTRRFRRALRWRTGIEARISTLKHRFGMLRAQYKGEKGFKRYVGWSVIAHNLISIARVKCKREAKN